MKTLLISIIATLTLTLASCNYLDVIPEGKPTMGDIYKTPQQTQAFLYYLYSELPDRVYLQAMPDLCGGGDFITGYYGAAAYFKWKSLIYGMESSSSTYFGMWSVTSSNPARAFKYDMFGAIRYCYNLIDNVGSVPGITEEEIRSFTGEALFLIGYYHQLMLEYYGPIVLVEQEIPLDATPAQMYLSRRPYDQCVNFIAQKYTDAAALLPSTRGNAEIARATAATALGMKARLLLYAASPLVNGNTEFYANFKNKDNEPLISQTYDAKKWKTAMDAAEAAIIFCEDHGYKLFDLGSTNLSDEERGRQNYHACFVGRDGSNSSWNTDEILFAATKQGSNSYNNKNMGPRIKYTSYSSSGFRGYLIPTWDCVEMYYTKNGLPLDKDPLTKNMNLYSVAPGDSTALLNRNREPRFYASIGYDRGKYEIDGTTMVLHCRRGEPQQNDGNNSHEYQSDNGYYCQKWISKADTYNKSSTSVSCNKYAFPLLRLAELYLSYAEADFEYTGSLSPKSLIYLNKVRYRAGLPNFEASWAMAGGIPSGEELRQVLRQERSIEFLMEARRFHDIRRWKIAHIELMRPQKAWNLAGKTQKDFYQIKSMREGGTRVFDAPKAYWLAIPLDQLNTNSKLVQNPGY